MFIVNSILFNLDVINTRNPNPNKPLPYHFGIAYMLALTIMALLVYQWYLKMTIFLSVYSLNIFVLNEFEHETYYIHMVMVFIFYLMFAHIFKTKNDVINKYLDKL